ncbi:MAG: hypothetical protein KOO60_08405 [Gemmatimonadales bacterium]|nr:hypothetical protein [Gemmatimonadales bacterium]
MKQRRRWSLWAGIIYTVILVAVAIGLGGLYIASRDRLDEAMGDRLLAVANSLAVMIDGERVFALTVGDSSAAGYVDSLALRLDRVRLLDSLAEITLNDPEGRVLFSTLPNLTPGKFNDFWDLDPAAVDMACQGFAQTTRLYHLQSTFQKSAHAPVMVFDPGFEQPLVVAILTVSGNPDFFDSLASLRHGAFVTGAIVLMILLLLGGFLYRINRSLERYQASIVQQENLAAMGRMTAGIAHEIRNPLGIIRGAGEHLQMLLADAGIQDETVDFIPEEVDRLDHILAGYLAFGSGREGPVEEFDLGVITRRGVNLLAEDLSTSGVSVNMGTTAEAPVQGEPRRWQQVVLNLLLNARDAMPGGGEIDIELELDGSAVRLTLADQGTGLESSDPNRLFEPFWTTKEKGSGLGLALSRRIVGEMDGTLDLADRKGGPGVVATVRLPLLPRVAEENN